MSLAEMPSLAEIPFRMEVPSLAEMPKERYCGDIRMADGTLLVKSMNISLCFGLTSQIKFASIRY